MLSVRNLVKTYQTTKSKKKNRFKALNNVSIDFPEHGLVFILGKSGSGKSTLLNSIGGLDSFDSGEIIIKGKSSKEFTQQDFDSYRNTFIGFIFQEYNIIENFTVAKNIAFALELQGKKANKETVLDLLEKVDLKDYAKRKPNQLSGGQKQRVAIARALIKNPEIIMADEPTGALDSTTGKQVMETLQNLSKKKLIIVVSHDREFAEIYGDRIIELKDGKVISDQTKKEIIAEKTKNGLSVVDNKFIHIKKGSKIEFSDVKAIVQGIMDNNVENDVIITLSRQENEKIKKVVNINDDGNNEVFIDTKPEDIKRDVYSGSKLNLIRSKLKQRDSFKIGASALKHKVGKLIFTIILSVFAFTCFGIVDAFASWNRVSSVSDAIDITKPSCIAIQKREKIEYTGYSYYRDRSSQKEDVSKLENKFKDRAFVGVCSLGSDYILELQDERTSNSAYNYIYNSSYIFNKNSVYGFTSLNENQLKKFGLKIIKGNLPTGKNEICISEHTYKCLEKFYSKSLEIIGQSVEVNYYMNSEKLKYKVVGVISDGVDLSNYDNLNENDDDYLKAISLDDLLNYSFARMVYVTSGELESFYDYNPNKESDTTSESRKYSFIMTTNNEKNSSEFISFCETKNNGYYFNILNDATSFLDSFEDTANSITSYMIYGAIAFGLFASLLMMNYISTSISYKKREIGVLRALGARSKDVFGIFFNESLIIAFINFILSGILTAIACVIINKAVISGLGISLTLLNMGIKQILLILAISVGAAFISSLIPVSRISKKKPIDSIHNR